MPSVKNLSTGAKAECETGASLRIVAQEQGLDIPFGCESGICCTCLIKVKSGLENLSARTEQEEMTLDARGAEPNERLACQCTVNGDLEFEQ